MSLVAEKLYPMSKQEFPGSHDVSIRDDCDKVTETDVWLNIFFTSTTFFFVETTLRPKFAAALFHSEIPSVFLRRTPHSVSNNSCLMTVEGVKAAVLCYAQMAFQRTIGNTYCLRLATC